MKIIYEPKGAALEYSELAINLYEGCEHGCKYCYAPACRFKKKEEYFNTQTIRNNILEKLEKDLEEMVIKEDNRRTLFCFICDPYQKDDNFNIVTRKALTLFNAYNKSFQILTKGGMKAVRDFDLYSKRDAYAATLTFYDEEKSRIWEPNAATPKDRIKSLETAKKMGIETWASFEPVIDPEETCKLLEATYEFTDLYKVGKINRYKTGIEVDWKEFTYKIINRLEQLNKKYYIKESLKPYI